MQQTTFQQSQLTGLQLVAGLSLLEIDAIQAARGAELESHSDS